VHLVGSTIETAFYLSSSFGWVSRL